MSFHVQIEDPVQMAGPVQFEEVTTNEWWRSNYLAR